VERPPGTGTRRICSTEGGDTTVTMTGLCWHLEHFSETSKPVFTSIYSNTTHRRKNLC
jgi:hypothetical protein